MTTTRRRTVTPRRQQKALELVAAWLGPQMREDGKPVETGDWAARNALGPMLVPDWDWPGEPTPTLLLEGGPDDWAYYAAADETLIEEFGRLRIFAEPYAGCALCLYPE